MSIGIQSGPRIGGSDSLLMKSDGGVVLTSRGESAPCINRCGQSRWYPAVLLL